MGLIISYAVINLPIAINNFAGWSFFFRGSFSRGVGYGSIWEVLEIFGIKLSNINLVYIITSLLLFFLIAFVYFKVANRYHLYELAFLSIFAFTALNKVYSPQFILWLTPLAVLAIRNRKQVIFFCFWQLLELAYHIAIWRYFYEIGGGQVLFSVSPNYYAVISLIRLLTLVAFALSLIHGLFQDANNQQNVKFKIGTPRR